MNIKWNLRLITIVPITLLLLTSGYFLINTYIKYKTLQQMDSNIYNTKALKTLAINLSRERGLSILYNAEKNYKIRQLLTDQRVITNNVINNILSFNANSKNDIYGYKIVDDLKKIEKRRASIDDISGYNEIFSYYDGINTNILQKIKSYLSTPVNININNLSSNFIKSAELMNSIANERDTIVDLITNNKQLNRSYLIALFKNNRIATSFETLLPQFKSDLSKVISDENFIKSIKNSDLIKRDILESNTINSNINKIEWFSNETDKLIHVNKISNIIYDNLRDELLQQKHNLIYKITFLAFLLLLSLYMIYLYTRLYDFLYDTQGLENLLSKIVNYGLIEDAIDLRTTTGVKRTYSVIEQSVDKIAVEKKNAERANAAKSIFLANMSHEIRTPINGIIGFTDLLKNSKLEAQEKEYVNIIQKSTDNLLEIINNILDLSKVESKKIEIDEILFSPIEELENAVDVYMAEAENKKINLSLIMDPDFDHYLLGDPTKIKEVLQNLISNAIKFTPQNGQVSVFIKNQKSSSKDLQKIYFEISDNGIGIDRKDMKDIFNAFSQADSTITRKFGGTGLGLTISSNYISLMGGKLELESSPGIGSNFYFTLELKQEKPLKTVYKNSFSHINPLVIKKEKQSSKLDEYLIETIDYLCYGQKNGQIEDLSDSKILEDINLIITQTKELTSKQSELLKELNIPILDIGKTFQRSSTQDKENHFFAFEPLHITKLVKTLKSIETKTDLLATVAEGNYLKTDEQYKALVAEDNEINLQLITTILKNLNFNISTVVNGKEAVQLRKKEDFDIIFMDIAMPVMDGISATKEIIEYEENEKLDHIPIIALTANALKGDREKFLNEGLDDYLPKPTKEEQIKEIAIKYNVYNPKKIEQKQDISKVLENDILTEHSKEIEEEAIKQEADKSEEKLSVEYARQNILIYKKSAVESKIFEKVLKQLYKKVSIAENLNEFIQKIKENNYKVVMIDKEIPELNIKRDLLKNIQDRDNTILLLFRGFDSIINDQTRRDFDEVLINSADKVYLKLILDNHLKATDRI